MRRTRSLGLTSIPAMPLAFAAIGSIGCHGIPNTRPTVVASLQEVQTDISRAGRLVAISVNASDAQMVIGASESGGLFRTTDRGATWRHVDALQPFRMVDVAFAERASSNSQVVIATTLSDASVDSTTNSGGVWRSIDAGTTWTHVIPPVGCKRPISGHGIAFSGANTVFVAADCGLLASSDLGSTWTLILFEGVNSVVAQPIGASTLVDVCLQSQRHQRSVDAGASWGAKHVGPSCDGAHTIAVSPRDTGVLFATMGTGLSESDNGGANWTNLSATSFNERPVWVRTRMPIDLSATHFDLYFPGRRAVCTGAAPGLRCPSNVGEVWPRVPSTPLNHDINGIAFDPGGICPAMMVADFGVYRQGPATAAAPCGTDAAWTHVGRASAGLGSLQIYQITGQLHYPVTGGGVNISGFTNLFIGTQDNLLWVTNDAGGSGWTAFGVEGSFLQTVYAAPIASSLDLQLTYMDFGGSPASKAIRPTVANGTWSSPAAFTGTTPPGSGTAPAFVSPHTYVQWSGGTLFLTEDGGTSWSPIAVLPPNPVSPASPLAINGFGASRMTRTPAGPAMYEFVSGGGKFGLVLITRLTPQTTPRVADLRSFDGKNAQGFATGMTHIAGYCFEPGAWYCDAIYAVDPNDYNHLLAADASQGGMIRSYDAGRTWNTLLGLTSLVTDGGTLAFDDGNGRCQAHVIAYDPGNSAHVLVGTDRAGIIASSDSGLTWRALPNTRQATNISSIFFDDRTNVIYVGTYGRGLWKLTVDWSTVVP